MLVRMGVLSAGSRSPIVDSGGDNASDCSRSRDGHSQSSVGIVLRIAPRPAPRRRRSRHRRSRLGPAARWNRAWGAGAGHWRQSDHRLHARAADARRAGAELRFAITITQLDDGPTGLATGERRVRAGAGDLLGIVPGLDRVYFSLA